MKKTLQWIRVKKVPGMAGDKVFYDEAMQEPMRVGDIRHVVIEDWFGSGPSTPVWLLERSGRRVHISSMMIAGPETYWEILSPLELLALESE